MANNKTKPAAGKSVAGKTNSKKNKSSSQQREKERRRQEAEKQAKRVIEDKQKQEKELQKKSEEIKKRRAKEKKKAQKASKKGAKKESRTDRKNENQDKRKERIEKIKYYLSKEFWSSFNYKRIVVFIVLPIIIVISAVYGVMKTVTVNVPSEIRNYVYNGRLESEPPAGESLFNKQQQSVFTEALDSYGSRKFSFYINTDINIDDRGRTQNLCFGNPDTNDCILIAAIYDDDGTVIYRSLGLDSGKEINEARLFKELSYGTHEVKAAVNAYDKKTGEKIGTRYADIRLLVGVGEDAE